MAVAYPPGGRATPLARPAERHRPRNRVADLDHLLARLEEAEEAAPRPVVEVAGGIPEGADVLEPGEVENPPERFAGNAHDQPRARQLGERLQGRIGVLEVLEHLAA